MPGFKTFLSTVLSASDVNSYLMKQAVIQCTAATRPSSPHEGMTIAVTDKDRVEHANVAGNWVRGTAWAEAGRTGARGVFAGSVAIPNNVSWNISLNSVTFDSDGAAVGATYTVPLAGLWTINFQHLFGASFTAGSFFGRIVIVGRSTFDFCGFDGGANASGSLTLHLEVGEQIRFDVFQNSGSTQTTTTGGGWWIYRISA